MRKAGIDKAIKRLSKCKDSMQELLKSASFDEMEAAWEDYLISAHAIYEILKHSSKGNGKSEAWFGRKVRIRKSDELLKYLHHARNSNEHSLRDSTVRRPGFVAFGVAKPGFSSDIFINKFEMKDGKILSCDMASLDGKPILNQFTPGKITLLSVMDSGQKYDIPSTHLGKDVSSKTIFQLCEISHAYFSSLVSEAKSYID